MLSRSKPRTVSRRFLLILTILASLAVFACVQDRVTAAGARRYVSLQRAAAEGRGPAVTVDEVMQPAIRESVRSGALWGGLALVVGVAVAFGVGRRPLTGRSRRGTEFAE
jgi:ABC-type Fe3+ transport system permease subunit